MLPLICGGAVLSVIITSVITKTVSSKDTGAALGTLLKHICVYLCFPRWIDSSVYFKKIVQSYDHQPLASSKSAIETQ